jgi:hypothetical protein
MARPQGKKIPKIVAAPEAKKEPRIAALPPSFRGGVIAWRFNAVDKNGPFSWLALDDPAEHKAVIEAMADIETMREADLDARGCHFIALGKLAKAAQDRLMELRLDDLDELYSIRLNGRGRVFCVHRPQYMRVLWFDPDHQVCPSVKKHT